MVLGTFCQIEKGYSMCTWVDIQYFLSDGGSVWLLPQEGENLPNQDPRSAIKPFLDA